MIYKDELQKAMELCAAQPRSVFLGQAIAYSGTAMTQSFVNVPREKLIELPVAEDMQLGLATGMSLNGDLPICVYPRINFLLLAMNQLILHLDALPEYSGYKPKVIIRTAVATERPLNPGPQHLGDFSRAIADITTNINVFQLLLPQHISECYKDALESPISSILVEYSEKY